MMKTVETLVAAREKITAALDAQKAPEKAAVENALRDLSADLDWARSELAKAHLQDSAADTSANRDGAHGGRQSAGCGRSYSLCQKRHSRLMQLAPRAESEAFAKWIGGLDIPGYAATWRSRLATLYRIIHVFCSALLAIDLRYL